MDILQIYIDKDMPDEVKNYMVTVKKYLPKATHYFVGDRSNVPPESIWLDPIQEQQKAKQVLGHGFWWNLYCTENKYSADMIRLAWAVKNPDLFYVDADVEFIKAPVITKSDLPLIGINNDFQEFFLFYTNNACDWFSKLVDKTVKGKAFPSAFMGVFGDIKLGRCLIMPDTFKNNSFFVRH